MRLLVHVPRDGLDVFDRRHRQDAVAEIEDVAGPAAGARPGRRRSPARMRSSGASSSVGSRLPWMARSNPMRVPGLVERDPPVGADDVAAGLAQLAENRARADAEMDRRHAERREPFEDRAACAAG